MGNNSGTLFSMAEKYGNFFIQHPLLFLCEGAADAAFVRKGLEHGTFAAPHHIQVPGRRASINDEWKPTGISGIGETLSSYRGNSGIRNLRHVVIVIDSDEPLGDSVRNVRNQIISANQRGRTPPFGVPANSYARATAANGVDVTIVTVPSATATGCLETLYLQAATNKDGPNAAHARAYAAKTGAANWQLQSKRDKMLLRSMIAGTFEAEPDVGVGNLWRETPYFLPIDRPEFQPLITFLCQQTA
jgi:hypothetical protein